MIVKEIESVTSVLKNFIKKSDSYASLANIAIKFTKNEIVFSATNGDCGCIAKLINNLEKPFVDEFTINGFDFVAFINSLDSNQNIIFERINDKSILIRNDKFKRKMEVDSYDKILNMVDPNSITNWQSIDKKLSEEIKLACENEFIEETDPIASDFGYIFSPNARRLFMVKSSCPKIAFKVIKKHAQLVVHDGYTNISINETFVCFKNDKIFTFIPTYIGNIINVSPLLKKVQSFNNYRCVIDSEEFQSTIRLFKSIPWSKSTFNEELDFVKLIFTQKEIICLSPLLETKISILGYDGPDDIKIKISRYNLSSLSKLDNTINILLSKANSFLYAETNEAVFIGAAMRDND